ncbi:actin related protein 2/3 complex [Heterostelium album PN500]|uniref:Actin-related protein 2/3 complex subunit 5 n=1 Tax=Heterostelium pallidum (strain ATCC 26659 / Pp 5 / PN500) TaxID=670386 RepID=D3BAU2_HETP5|nr:actin related protein 2/3 complex [Heterostelium album PN500]EFA81679.1 actin related protein 2/3 complex [Heterostelium album PN500]|eukprot:XP_020433796.1 actin related protein 2/3 complex [Heterostelium album PN500]
MSNYEEENIEEKTTGGKSDAEYKSDIAAREREVTKFLNQSKAVDALPVVLADPPIYTKSQAIKDQNAAIVINVLSNIKEKEIDGCLESLDADQLDILMKYIYRGLAAAATSDNTNAALFFKWYEATLKKAGMGCVVRAISERKTV